MPEYSYSGRDREGKLRSGKRTALNEDILNAALIQENIFPLSIKEVSENSFIYAKLQEWLQGRANQLIELSIFCRQMQLLQKAGVPIDISIKQLAANTRSMQFRHALEGVVEYVQNGQTLAAAMKFYPNTFSPLMINIIDIGENTGHLSNAFEHIFKYLEFEANNMKQIKSAFRYPMFVLIAVIAAIMTINIFVIPTFAKLYGNLNAALPWQTQILIASSNFFIYYGYYALAGVITAMFFWKRYLATEKGKMNWDYFKLQMPLFGNLIRRIMLIRFSQSLSIMLNSAIPITTSLKLMKNIISNTFITRQIVQMQEAIERGTSFSTAITKVDLFTPLEIQILGVGEKNNQLGDALSYIATFHTQEIEYQLIRISQIISPILIALISALVLLIALGVYLPIWNMIGLVH